MKIIKIMKNIKINSSIHIKVLQQKNGNKNLMMLIKN